MVCDYYLSRLRVVTPADAAVQHNKRKHEESAAAPVINAVAATTAVTEVEADDEGVAADSTSGGACDVDAPVMDYRMIIDDAPDFFQDCEVVLPPLAEDTVVLATVAETGSLSPGVVED
jgi:hypothetical protein